MSLESGIYTRLSGYANLTALVLARIYPKVIPQDCLLPAVEFQKISETPEHAMGSDPSIRQSRIQVSAFAETYSEVKAVSAQIKAALSRYSGTSSGTVIQDIFFEGDYDLYEPDTGIYHAPSDFIVWYEA